MLSLLTACQLESGKKQVRAKTQTYQAADDFPVFSSGGIDYVGLAGSNNNTEAFLGIPFAQPPVGELRWQAPLPWQSDQATFVAQEFGDACMQGPHLANWYQDLISSFGGDPNSFPLAKVSEDCLYLNIWRPATSIEAEEGKTSLPVYVFIHGGSNKGGWSYEPNYIGEQLAEQGAIVVTIAYRLGVFGFFAHPDLEQANFALLDQIAALQWIQDNIAAVGGDLANVTVAGESAGANNIAYLMASPLAHGLFHNVVFESAGWAMSGAMHKVDYESFGRELGASLFPNAKADISALRSVAAEQLLEASYPVYQQHFYDPVIDGYSIKQSVADSAARGELMKVNMIVGANANESLMYLDADETVDSWLAANVSSAQAEKLLAELDADSPSRQQLDRLATANGYVCPSLELASAVVESGGSAWVYYFTRVREGKLAAEMGAYHGAELPYIFDTHDDWLPTTDQDHRLSSQIMQYWLEFMQQRKPEAQGLPEWPAYLQAGDDVMVLGDELQVKAHSSRALCAILSQQ
ncbi:MAG: carboxylesterase family protein [Pseudomonadota bacterium]